MKISSNTDKKNAENLFSNLHPADIAEIINSLTDHKKKEIFNSLNLRLASDVLLDINEKSRAHILDTIQPEKLADIVEEMESDDAADLIGNLTNEDADTILDELEQENSEEVRNLLKFDPESAGGLMQTEVFSVRQGMLIEDAIVQFMAITDEVKDIENIHNVFVVNSFGKLVGIIPIGKLILNKPNTPITEMMEDNFLSVKASIDQEEVANLFKKYDIVSLPVIDDAGILLGRILVDDIVDVLDEEASEDILRISGVFQDEHIFDDPVQSVRMRMPWLILNLGTALLSAMIIGFFKDTISTLVILAVFMPVVAGMGGNAGTQSLAVSIRGIALGELDFKNSRKALLKGLYVGLMNGSIAGLIIAIIAYFWVGKTVLSLILFISMILNILVANLSGIAIPVFLKWIKVDPAVASAVFLTSLTDCLGFLSFLGLSTLLINMLMG